MPKMTSWIKIFLVVMGAAALYACSNANGTAPIVDSSGKHPAAWVERHWIEYKKSTPGAAKVAGKAAAATAVDFAASPCAECHGADLLGGITKVSCFSAKSQSGQACHATGPVTGSHGWRSATDHGTSGAMAAPAISAGFAYCTKCHGSTYDNGNAVSCKSCHTTAPHPPRPWHGTTASGTNHVNTDTANAVECAKCHTAGANLLGQRIGAIAPAGTTPGCFNGTLCHDTSTVPHVQSAAFLSSTQHGPLAKANLTTCQACHAVPSSGANPQFNVPRNNMPVNGCETCHKAGTAHPTPWLPGRVGTPFDTANTTSHTTAGNLATACALCHGAALDGVGGTAPSCMSSPRSGISCHVTNPATTPTGCTSCHGNPPATGAHAAHLSLPNVTCDVCHFGAGSGTLLHANGVSNMALLDVNATTNSFKAKTGVFSLNADKTCSAVSCHGGQTTPAWVGGSINVNADCLLCHQQGTASQTPQFNSFFSGGATNQRHVNHLQFTPQPGTGLPQVVVFCTDCHSTALLSSQQHFGGLNTAAFEGAPADTIGGQRFSQPYVTTGASRGNCTVTCHTFVPATNNWFQ